MKKILCTYTEMLENPTRPGEYWHEYAPGVPGMPDNIKGVYLMAKKGAKPFAQIVPELYVIQGITPNFKARSAPELLREVLGMLKNKPSRLYKNKAGAGRFLMPPDTKKDASGASLAVADRSSGEIWHNTPTRKTRYKLEKRAVASNTMIDEFIRVMSSNGEHIKRAVLVVAKLCYEAGYGSVTLSENALFSAFYGGAWSRTEAEKERAQSALSEAANIRVTSEFTDAKHQKRTNRKANIPLITFSMYEDRTARVGFDVEYFRRNLDGVEVMDMLHLPLNSGLMSLVLDTGGLKSGEVKTYTRAQILALLGLIEQGGANGRKETTKAIRRKLDRAKIEGVISGYIAPGRGADVWTIIGNV